MPEVFTYSSNIGTARMALALGVEHHKWFLKKLGQLDRLRTELPESAEPLVPKRWGELNTVTIAFGHGLSVAPLQAVMAIGALVNGGCLIPPTFLKRTEEEAHEARQAGDQARDQREDALPDAAQRREGHRQARPTSRATTSAARPAPSEKVVSGRYSKTKLLTTFTAVLPADKPRYLVLIMLDEPQGLPETHGYRHLGLERRADGGQGDRARSRRCSGIEPRFDLPPADQLILASGAKHAARDSRSFRAAET